jgi:hypothetical protein
MAGASDDQRVRLGLNLDKKLDVALCGRVVQLGMAPLLQATRAASTQVGSSAPSCKSPTGVRMFCPDNQMASRQAASSPGQPQR